MKKLKKRSNGKGSAVYLGNGRYKPWVARIVIGKDINGIPIYYDIDNFEEQLDALVFLENYHKEPYSLYVKQEKYNRIVTFPPIPYPLVAVENPHQDIVEKVKKDNYTFKQLFEKFKETKMLTKEEMAQEKKYHIRPENKPFGRNYCLTLLTAFNNCKELHDRVYKSLRASDFKEHLKNSGKGPDPQRQMVNLFANIDKFALEEDIIEKGYSQFIATISCSRKGIKKSTDKDTEKDKLFSYEQIDYLWNFKPRSTGLQQEAKKEHEAFIRDFWLMLLYSGCRADELLSIYTANVFLENNCFIGGLKTNAGINREIPIHPAVKHLWEKYYNSDNEFLFMQPNGNRADYDYYLYHYKYNFKELHPEVSEHTAHDARHTLRTELKRLHIDDIIINSIIGHSNDDVGDDIYTHILVEEKLEAIKRVTYKEKKLYILSPEKQEKTS